MIFESMKIQLKCSKKQLANHYLLLAKSATVKTLSFRLNPVHILRDLHNNENPQTPKRVSQAKM